MTIQNSPLPGLDDILRVELDNGIIVLARENFTSPSVVVDGLVRGGALQNPSDKAGLSSFHGHLLTRGTTNYSFSELFEQIESIGASLNVGGGNHAYDFGSKSLAEDLPTMLHLLADVFQNPTFPDDHIEKIRGMLMTSFQIREHDTRSRAAMAFKELAYPNHPYGISSDGYLDTVNTFTRNDIVDFHRNLGPQGAIIVVVGAIKAEDAVQLVEDAFGGWKNPDQPEPPLAPDTPAPTEIAQEFITIPGKTQSDIVMGNPGPRRSASDYQATRMANSILGVFGMMGRLGDTVREEQGLAYYSYSRLSGGLGPGPWLISAGVAPDKVEQAVDSIRHEIGRIVSEPVSAEELADNKSFFKGNLVLGLETNDGVAGTLANIELYGLGLDYLRQYRQMIDAITVEDVQAAAQHYLDPDAYALGVAGSEIED